MADLVVNPFREGVRQSPRIADVQHIQGLVHRVDDNPTRDAGFRLVVLDGFVGQVYAVPVNKEADAIYVNLLDFFSDTADFKAYSGYVNGYLVLKEGKACEHCQVNHFVRRLLERILQED